MQRILPKPTEAELSILNVLWDLGPSTVRDVHDQLKAKRHTGYTTILKLLQIMHQKGLVTRDESNRTHIYQPRSGRQATQRQLVGDLLERAFGGSALGLVMQALAGKRASTAEMAEIKRVVAQMGEAGR